MKKESNLKKAFLTTASLAALSASTIGLAAYVKKTKCANKKETGPLFGTHNKKNKLKNIVILATGGTIAGKGKEGKSTGYYPAGVDANELIKAVPQIKETANIKAIKLFDIPSDDINFENIIEIAKKINDLDKDNSVDGIVITHGTDTMEETAYFLNLVCKTDKPVIITGAMRPVTAISADGPMNLYQAILVACSEEAKNMPVLTVMDEKIISSRTLQKTSTSNLNAMQWNELGLLGFVRGENVIFKLKETNIKYKNSSEFSIKKIENLPNIAVLHFYVDADVSILKFALEKFDGVVIAGAGEGGYGITWKETVEQAKKPIVLATRINNGIVLEENMRTSNCIPTSNLNPQKAAILLRIALWNKKNLSHKELLRIFREY